MNNHEAFSDAIYEDQTDLAERELSSFMAAVSELYGPEQARISAEDWLDESDLMGSPPRSELRNWRAVTISGFGSTGKTSEDYCGVKRDFSLGQPRG